VAELGHAAVFVCWFVGVLLAGEKEREKKKNESARAPEKKKDDDERRHNTTEHNPQKNSQAPGQLQVVDPRQQGLVVLGRPQLGHGASAQRKVHARFNRERIIAKGEALERSDKPPRVAEVVGHREEALAHELFEAVEGELPKLHERQVVVGVGLVQRVGEEGKDGGAQGGVVGLCFFWFLFWERRLDVG
jgi:hypothetical protein